MNELNATGLIPETGFMRQKTILGSPKNNPPIPGILPISPSSWWAGIKKGIYPSPVKLSANVTAWKVEDIRELIERINNQGEAE
jgi:predicted DNA-binding transcriptional regulator AlpA